MDINLDPIIRQRFKITRDALWTTSLFIELLINLHNRVATHLHKWTLHSERLVPEFNLIHLRSQSIAQQITIWYSK